MRLFRPFTKTRRRRWLSAVVTTTAAVAVGLVFAAVLGTSTGDSRGKVGELQNVTFQAGPAGDGIMPGEDGDASISAVNNNATSQWAVAIADTQTDWMLEGSPAGNLNGFLSVNAGPLPTAVEIPPGTNNIVLPNVFHAQANLDLVQYGGRTFIKPVTLTLASTAGG